MASEEQDVIMWVQLPRPMGVAELQKLGLAGAACYGGDTCIAAPEISASAGIVVQRNAGELYRRASLAPQGRCFGGDTCIV